MAFAWQLAVTIGLVTVVARWWVVRPARRYRLTKLAGCAAGCTVWFALISMLASEVLVLELGASIALLVLLPIELHRGRG